MTKAIDFRCKHRVKKETKISVAASAQQLPFCLTAFDLCRRCVLKPIDLYFRMLVAFT